MRTRKSEDMDVVKHQPKALEMILVKAGYSLRSIRGEETVRLVEREPSGPVAWLRERVPWLADPQPVRERTVERTPGMDRKEVLARVIQHDEHEQMKEEQAEAEAQKAQQGQPQGGR